MTASFGRLNARARGLAGHLLREPDLEHLRTLGDLAAIAAELARLGFERATPRPKEIELAIRRRAAALLGAIIRWDDPTKGVLEPILLDEDRRSVRALLRGAWARKPAEARLSGLIPTPRLSERALEELSTKNDARELAALLVTLGHPFGPSLLEESTKQAPSLFEAELALDRSYAERAAHAARRGDRVLREHVARTIDLENVAAAITLAGESLEDEDRGRCFLAGGATLSLETFLDASHCASPADAEKRLLERLPPGALQRAVGSLAEHGSLTRSGLAMLIDELTFAARSDPLSTAVAIRFLLRLRREQTDLLAILWRRALYTDQRRAEA